MIPQENTRSNFSKGKIILNRIEVNFFFFFFVSRISASFFLEALVPRMAGVEEQFHQSKNSPDPPSIFPNGNASNILIEQSPFPYRNKDQFLPARDHLSQKNRVNVSRI